MKNNVFDWFDKTKIYSFKLKKRSFYHIEYSHITCDSVKEILLLLMGENTLLIMEVKTQIDKEKLCMIGVNHIFTRNNSNGNNIIAVYGNIIDLVHILDLDTLVIDSIYSIKYKEKQSNTYLKNIDYSTLQEDDLYDKDLVCNTATFHPNDNTILLNMCNSDSYLIKNIKEILNARSN